MPPEGTTQVLQFPQVTHSRIYLYLLGDFHKGGGGPTHLQDGLSGGDTVLEPPYDPATREMEAVSW